METHNFNKKDYLDILFENRNKDYGAYQLRRGYDKRMTIAVSTTFGIGLIFLFSSFVLRDDADKNKPIIHVVELMGDIIVPEKEKIVEPEKPKPEVKQVVKTEDYVTMQVVKDDEVKPEDLPPTMDSLATAQIGTEKINGATYDGTVRPAGHISEGGGDAPEVEKEPETFVKVEIEAEFPGGNLAWGRFVSRAVERNIDDLQEDGRSGTVVILFVVDKEGKVSDVRALDCQEAAVANCLGKDAELAKVAVEAIKKGPDWKPAIQNGKAVKAYRRQPVTFRLAD